jgi:hypothetical protein
MASQGKVDIGTRAATVGAYSDLVRELRDLDERLRALVEMYEKEPSALDEAIGDSTDNAKKPEEVVTEMYRMMRNGVFAEHSPLRANRDLWEAFTEHQDEFIYFYKSARRALEIYAEVLRVYALIENVHGALPKRGDVKRIRQDKNAQVRERERCIEAIGDLYGKFSAMLAVL